MTRIALLLALLISSSSFAQDSNEIDVKNTVIKFFDAFHKQDSIAIKELVSKDLKLQSIGKSKEGLTQVRNEEFSAFLKSLAYFKFQLILYSLFAFEFLILR